MSKVTKKERIKELERQVRGLTVLFISLNRWSEYADNMLTELNHALPDPEYDAKCEAQEADIDASLDRHRERLGLNKPQLKQLDQSVFDGLDEKWRFAAINVAGALILSTHPIEAMSGSWIKKRNLGELINYGFGYDASNWHNSLIERDTAKELTGSELCRAMLARGDKFILCGVSDSDDSDAANHEDDDFLAEAVTDFDDKDGLFGTTSMRWNHAVPLNNQGEPLTQAEAGL